MVIKTIIYQIFGYLDNSKNMGYREYKMTGGLALTDPNTMPIFLVTIPLDNQQQCIFDASEVMGNIFIKE